MNIFQNIKSILFDPGAKPAKEWFHETLGRTSWSEDDEAWVGSYRNIKFLLGYERESETPSQEVLDYALDILSPCFDVLGKLSDIKNSSLTDFHKNYHSEITQLNIDSIHFYRHKNNNNAIASLAGGDDYRAWRFYMHDNQISNLGFDS